MRKVTKLASRAFCVFGPMLLVFTATLSAVEPSAIRQSLEVAEEERSTGLAIGVELLPDSSPQILSIELDDGTVIEVRTSDFSVFRTSRPLFARRQRRVGRAVGSLPAQEVGLDDAYGAVLEADGNPAIDTNSFLSVGYLLNRERVLIRVEFVDATRYVNPRTGDLVEL